MKRFLIVIATALFVLSSCHRAPGADGWFADFDSAQKAAKAQNKGILMLITTEQPMISQAEMNAIFATVPLTESASYDDIRALLSDRAQEIIELKAELLSKTIETDSFRQSCEENFALVHYNVTETHVPDILNSYQIQTAPSLLVLTKEGFCAGIFEFDNPQTLKELVQGTNTESQLLRDIRAVQTEIVRIEELASVARTASESQATRLDAIDTIFKNTNQRFIAPLEPLAKVAVSIDPKNESGRIGNFYCFLADIQANKFLQAEKVTKAARVYERLAESDYLDAAQKQEYYYAAAVCFANELTPDYKKTLQMLDKAREADPNSEQAQKIQESIDYIKSMQEYAANGAPEQDEPIVGPELPPQE